MKRKTIWGISALATIALLHLAFPSTTHACSCAPTSPLKEGMQGADAVFTGKVISIGEQSDQQGYRWRSVIFEVTATWKGVSQSQVEVRTGFGNGDCGVRFRMGERYIVFASAYTPVASGKKILDAQACSPTAGIVHEGERLEGEGLGVVKYSPSLEYRAVTEEDIGVLGAGKAPTEHVELVSPLSLPLYVLIAIILALGSLALLRLVRYRSVRAKANRF